MLFFLFFFLDLNGDVREYVSYMIGGLCIKVCAYAVIGKNSVSAERLGVSHHIEMHITAGKLDFAFSDSLHDVFVGSDKVILAAGSFHKFGIFRNIVFNFVSFTKSGVINAGEFSYGLIKTAEFNFYGIADNYIFCILPLIGYSVSYLCGSYHLICGFAVCGKLENVIAFNKTGSSESAVAVLFDVLPACAFIGGKLNGGFCTVKGSIEIKGCGIFKRIHCVKLCIPFISRTDRFHGKLILCAAYIDNHNACTLRIGGSVNSAR